MFTLEGRMGRMAYFITTLLTGVMFSLAGLVFLNANPPLNIFSPEMLFSLIGWAVGIIAFAWLWSATVRRLHDMNLSGLWSILVYAVPILILVLWLWPGTLAFNRFDLY